MAMLAVVILGHLGGIIPHIILPAILRRGWLYWLVVLWICLLYIAELTIGAAFGGYPILGTFVVAVLGIFILMAGGGILGSVNRDRVEKLDWLS